MEKHLIVLDLDGTTLDDFYTINSKNKEVIDKLINLDHIIVIVTARPFRMMKHFYEELSLDTIIANANGAYIHLPNNEDFEEIVESIPYHLIKDILNGPISKHINKFFAVYKDDIYLENQDSEIIKLPQLEAGNVYVRDFKENELETNEFIIEVLPDYKEIVKEYLDNISELHHFEWNNEYSNYIDITRSDINKATAIKVISEYYDIPNDRTIAIGDGINDIEMLKYAGIGVAVNNAFEEVKEAADIILDYSNKDGGVGIFLEEFFNL